MPSKAENQDRRSEHSAHSVLQSTNYSQPWWHGAGDNPSFDQRRSKSSPMEQLNGSLTNGAIQSQANTGLDNGANQNKDMQVTVSSQSDGSNGQERRLEQVSASTPVTMDGRIEPNSQMELVGHSIVLTSYPYSDPQYGGILTPYSARTMVPPQLYGMHHTRMPLPLEMEEEPVYVNAKQFHGILRRRQARAKAELEKKAIKVRKPYLHESRHQHAMRRARGCGGRFLSAKKLDDIPAANPTSDGGVNSDTDLSIQSASSFGFQPLSKGPVAQDMQARASCNGNHNGHSQPSMYNSSNGIEGGYLSKQRESTYGNRGSHGPLPIN